MVVFGDVVDAGLPMVRTVGPDTRTVQNEAIYKLDSPSRLLDRSNPIWTVRTTSPESVPYLRLRILQRC